jgi:sulfur carrier protein
MTIQINGEPAEIGGEMTVTQLLAERKVKMPDMVSVELNGEILSRGTFGETAIKDGDKVEFLYFMGGGAGRGGRR